MDPFVVLGLAALAALGAFVAAIVYKARKTSGPTVKEIESLYAEFDRLIKRKAKYLSMLEVLDDAKKYGRISTSQYAEQAGRIKKKVQETDKKIDEVISRLALPYYKKILKQETAVEGKKLNYLLVLQEDKKKLQQKVLELEKTLDALRRKLKITEEARDELEEEVRSLEEKHKNSMLEMESRLDAASKKIAALQNELEALRKEKEEIERKLVEVSEKEKEYKKRAWAAEKQLEARGAKEEEVSRVVEKYSAEEEELKKSLEKAKKRMEEYYHKILLLQTIIDRYADKIETEEARTIQQVKESVQPKNKKVLEVCEIITSEIPEYDPKRDLLKACQLAYERVSERIASVKGPGITFWMTIDEILDKRIADYEDKAILLCSVLRALGADASVLILQMSDGANFPVVELRHGEKVYWLDPNHPHEFNKYSAGSREEVMKEFSAEGAKPVSVLYEFNDQEYKQKE